MAYMFVGSTASTLHGPPRSTQDIDIVIALGPPDLPRLIAAFPAHRFYLSAEAAGDAVRRRGPFNVIDLESGWKANLMVRTERALSLAELGRRQPADILGVATWVASPEDTILSKLEWSALEGGSARQVGDVRGVLAGQGAALDRDYLGQWAERLGVAAVLDGLLAELEADHA